MNGFWKVLFAMLVGLSLLVVLAVVATVWGGLHWALDPSTVLVIDNEVIDFHGGDLGDALGALIGFVIAAVVVLVVVPGSLLIALLAVVFALAVAALSLFGVAAMLLSPVLVPLGAVLLFAWLWSRRQRQQARNRQRGPAEGPPTLAR